MAWPFATRDLTSTAEQEIGSRTSARMGGTASVTRDQALKQSAAWACLRLRADMVSMMPVDVYRSVTIAGEKLQVTAPTPPVLQQPGGAACDIAEFMYSTQYDLDSLGNAFGIVKLRDGMGLPALIELLPGNQVTVAAKDGVLTYRSGREVFAAGDVWHEKQYTLAGHPVGLGPLAYAAASIRGYLSAQQFAADWFGNSGVPAAHLKNTARTLDVNEADRMKRRFKAAMSNGDTFVSGSDWEYNMIAAEQSAAAFLDERKFGLGDICRFLGVPGDLIDIEYTGGKGSITYANITQRNLQFLILHLDPAISRRERALSKLTSQPRYVKLNRGALLRMDLPSRYAAYKVAIDGRWQTPSEVRALEDLPPLTDAQLAEFAALKPVATAPALPTTDPTAGTDNGAPT